MWTITNPATCIFDYQPLSRNDDPDTREWLGKLVMQKIILPPQYEDITPCLPWFRFAVQGGLPHGSSLEQIFGGEFLIGHGTSAVLASPSEDFMMAEI